ncbi:hypothetical protein [Sphingobium sp. Sx8-8]|uniref:hypothetical protein n=1 Tax=Sphingobium sp. Sx8-8 TaxID=2933617 RepID=UPI001F55D08F|nr:hypothetical protein [Sphingobium sp. Sx8-8]
MEDDRAASQLRLSSARRRIDAFIEQIDILSASSFPHDDGEAALAAIRHDCVKLRKDLNLPAGIRKDVVDQLCLALLDKVDDYTSILGFILRSTNVRNPFELHYIVKDLIRRVIGDDVSLLISSEWSYTPFTYPMSIDQLPTSILIGTPAPEAGNPLLIPLAGHEVGHSAWRTFGCAPHYAADVSAAVTRQIDTTRAGKDLLATSPLGPLDSERVIDRCAGHVMRQIEEVFCDLLGLFLFGHAFIASFDYLLGPGAGRRYDLDYPSDQQRMAILLDAASPSGDGLAIAYDPAMTDRWTSAVASPEVKNEAEIIDAATAEMVPRVRDELFARLRAKALEPPRQAVIKNVLASFERGEPHSDRVELGEIVSAGWLRLRALDTTVFFGKDDRARESERTKSYKVLADLVLKTIEVAEYHDRIAGHA